MRKLAFLLTAAAFAPLAGCAVPQPRGEGQYSHVQEPLTKAWYNLYLPVDYVRNNGRHPNPKIKRWPLVMTFHGMKPYDNALPQEREWEKQADTYGYIVCAPELRTSDSFMEYPLTKEHDYVLEDKRNVMAIMDHIFATTYADPKKVLSTSWSCGGYLAHYFPNRFPDRFACIATRLSNFCSSLMVEDTVPLYRDRLPVAVFIGDGDFPACKYESEEAVAWYTARGFRVVRGKMIDNMGHRRIPQTAAAFFAEQIGIDPLHPTDAAKTVAEVQMTEYFPPQELIAKLSPPAGVFLASARPDGRRTTPLSPVMPPPTASPQPRNQPVSAPPSTPAKPTFASATAGRKYPIDRRPTYDPNPPREEPPPAKSAPQQAAQSPPMQTAQQSQSPNNERPRNWLEPTKPAQPERIAAATPQQQAPAKPPATSPQQKPAQQPPPATPKNSPPGKQVGRDQPQLASAQKPAAPFNPQSAGRKDYDRLIDARPRDSGPALASAVPHTARPTNQAGPVASPISRQSKAQKVNIRIGGPPIGTAPHYLRYSVDLPRDKTEGADFLWMDNGVWMGDDPSGAKIIESPGLHFITVLVVTKGDVEYRGQAKIQVLDRAQTAATYRAPDRPS